MDQLFYDIGDWLAGIGGWAYVVAPLVMAGVAILPVPAEAPAMVNGLLFGPIGGTAVTWCGAMLGAVASFELARALGRPAAERLVTPARLRKADDLVERAGWGGLLLARFMPLVAFTALNWGAGLTPVTRWRFLWTTALGIVPGAIVFTVSGWWFARTLRHLPWIALIFAILLVAWWWRRERRTARATRSTAEDPPA